MNIVTERCLQRVARDKEVVAGNIKLPKGNSVGNK